MVFKTNDQLEYPHPLSANKGEKYYFGFEVILNISLFHITAKIKHNDGVFHTRYISGDLDLTLGTLRHPSVLKASLYYQPNSYDELTYNLYKISTIHSDGDGLRITFSDGTVLEDPLQKSQEKGLLFSAEDFL